MIHVESESKPVGLAYNLKFAMLFWCNIFHEQPLRGQSHLRKTYELRIRKPIENTGPDGVNHKKTSLAPSRHL